ncbi:uncharacterized protein ColSpa_00709 [Colletotrichum spaethianum]|uniref:Acid ceramidase N-terminal domain-containing protein n=1 Tax=Colletotrichum spaethianum TaxID=700344 RepID=A0AA37L230_9PEZI|nr:uncharacterized protein ColSpa_00709 [Colletotrichum spaethianum]GKT40528.1 hypothetical protein ColSpa_00709 [Colletotrichum spaethianum]
MNVIGMNPSIKIIQPILRLGARQEEKQTSAFPTVFTPTITDISIYRIDMGKPAEERYVQLAKEFAPQIRSVSPLFDEVVESLFSKKLAGVIKFTSRYALRKVFDQEQSKEIKSIASAAKIRTHLVTSHSGLVAGLHFRNSLGATQGKG